mmetsp:Transcript_9786/g.34494  ORF Transcript_9786/g.34494 Transcript_9786/m.34494 type:complete len:131 (-) Transcript_9786:260-652(-)
MPCVNAGKIKARLRGCQALFRHQMVLWARFVRAPSGKPCDCCEDRQEGPARAASTSDPGEAAKKDPCEAAKKDNLPHNLPHKEGRFRRGLWRGPFFKAASRQPSRRDARARPPRTDIRKARIKSRIKRPP